MYWIVLYLCFIIFLHYHAILKVFLFFRFVFICVNKFSENLKLFSLKPWFPFWSNIFTLELFVWHHQNRRFEFILNVDGIFCNHLWMILINIVAHFSLNTYHVWNAHTDTHRHTKTVFSPLNQNLIQIHSLTHYTLRILFIISILLKILIQHKNLK